MGFLRRSAGMRAVVAAVASVAFVVACATPARTFRKAQVLGGKKVSARALNNGAAQYVNYCSACHGVNGDGKGPASYALRPPPRDFRQGKYKFAAVSSGQLPNDEDFLRIVQGGLHGTAMLPWSDVPQKDLWDIIQYIKTFSPRWADGKPGEPVVAGADPWGEAQKTVATTRGSKVYHGFAQCLLCHPSYEPAEVVNAASMELSKREAQMRPDAFHSTLKESDYGVKIMPPDFTRDPIRSGEKLTDLYRTIASGIGGTAMPAWKGALPDEDIWAMAYYVRSLIEIRDTPAANALKERLIASHPAATVAQVQAPVPGAATN